MIRSLRHFRGVAEARREPCFEGHGACGAVSVFRRTEEDFSSE
jgi:hypothetical protein